jgi:hypothetical protein
MTGINLYDLADTTEFNVINGCWNGAVVEENGKKYIWVFAPDGIKKYPHNDNDELWSSTLDVDILHPDKIHHSNVFVKEYCKTNDYNVEGLKYYKTITVENYSVIIELENYSKNKYFRLKIFYSTEDGQCFLSTDSFTLNKLKQKEEFLIKRYVDIRNALELYYKKR